MNINSSATLLNVRNNTNNNITYAQRPQKHNQNPSFINNSTKAVAANYIANYMPLSFTGNAPEIKNAFIITSTEDIPIVKSQNNSYVVEFDTQTEAIYGKDAVKYLKDKTHFEYDTQIIFPAKATGSVEIDGKEVDIEENSSIILSAGADAKVKVKKGYPLLLSSKRDFDWYARHNKDSKNPTVSNKFLEMIHCNSHLYNRETIPTLLIDPELLKDSFLNKLNINKYQEGNNLLYALYNQRDKMNEEQKEKITFSKNLLDKMYAQKVISPSRNGYIKFMEKGNDWYTKEQLEKKGFSKKEIDTIMPVYLQTRQAWIEGRYSKHNFRNGMSDETVKKLMDADILYKAADKGDNAVYWKEAYESESHLREVLNQKEIFGDEQNQVVQAWHIGNKIGFDLTGLKLLSDKVAIYNLNSKINNWTLEKSCWVSNSTAIATRDGKAPMLGTSIVQTDITTPVPMERLRKEEHLHTHPADDDKRQTEVYLVTSGYAALNIVKNGKPEVKILKEGDLAVIAPNVAHCVNSVMGEYEQVVTQVPSAFQYGFGFKRNYDMPEGYTEKELIVEAFTSLLNAKEEDKKERPFISKLFDK